MPEDTFKNAKILIVDDEPTNIGLVESILKSEGYTRLRTTTDSRKALALFLEFKPDLLLLDLNMPHLDGHAVMRQIAPRIPPGSYFPILVITGEIDPESKHKALAEGAKDFLIKPFDPTEVLLRIRNLLTTRCLHLQLQEEKSHLEEKVRERTAELDQAQIEILFRLGLAAEYRDDATGKHTLRVGHMASLIAHWIGWPREQVELMRRAAPLHDVGKIATPDQVLLKPGKLTPEEFEEIKAHVTMGARILSGSPFALLHLAEEIALTHHEHWNGSGYLGLKGDEIPLSGRIVTVADVFDALVHKRPYKEAWPIERARAEIVQQAGGQFDPLVVEAFVQVLERDGESLLDPNRASLEPP